MSFTPPAGNCRAGRGCASISSSGEWICWAVSSLRDAQRLMVVHNLVRIYFQNETLTEQRGAVQSVLNRTELSDAPQPCFRIASPAPPLLRFSAALERRHTPRRHLETNHRDPRARGRRLYLSRRPRTVERQPGHGAVCRSDLFGRRVGRYLYVLGVHDAFHAARDLPRRPGPDVGVHAARFADDRGDVVMAEPHGPDRGRQGPA